MTLSDKNSYALKYGIIYAIIIAFILLVPLLVYTQLVINVNEAKINYQNKNYIKAIEICKKTINEADKHGYYDISEYSYLLLIYIYKDKKQLSEEDSE